MLTLPDLILRYPAMANLPPDRFAILQADTILIMGLDDGRWGTPPYGVYDVAQAALIAHEATLSSALAGDDSGIGNAPVIRTDVDDVQVEYAERMWDKLPYQEADLYSTAYGQAYARYRRMFFAGPRIA